MARVYSLREYAAAARFGLRPIRVPFFGLNATPSKTWICNMKIAHISDLHYLDLTGVKFYEFFNKRWTGGFNLLAGRAHTHQKSVVVAALERIKALQCAHLVVTGDLTNLAFTSEFVAVRELLKNYFDEKNLTIVPGNHDFYTRESSKARRFEKLIYENYPGDEAFRGNENWPFVQVRGDVALIGLCSAQPRPWFVAAGRVGQIQRLHLEDLLKRPELENKCKIIALHHHLYQVVTSPGERFRHLDDRKELLELCHKYHVDLVVHGHNHDFTQYKSENTVISEAGSCSVATAQKDNRRGKFNIYNIENAALRSIETYRYNEQTMSFDLWKITPLEEIPNAPQLR